MPVADKNKVSQRKLEMGHGSVHGNPLEGYGLSPITRKKNTVNLSEAIIGSPVRVGRRAVSMTAPHSAPTGLSRKFKSFGEIPSIPDLDGKRLDRNRSTPSPKPRRGNFHQSMPASLNSAPNLFDDESSDDEGWARVKPQSRQSVANQPSSRSRTPPPPPISSPPTLNRSSSHGSSASPRSANRKNAEGDLDRGSVMSPGQSGRKSLRKGSSMESIPETVRINSPNGKSKKKASMSLRKSPKPALSVRKKTPIDVPFSPSTPKQAKQKLSANMYRSPHQFPKSSIENGVSATSGPRSPTRPISPRRTVPKAPLSAPARISRSLDSTRQGGLAFAPDLDGSHRISISERTSSQANHKKLDSMRTSIGSRTWASAHQPRTSDLGYSSHHHMKPSSDHALQNKKSFLRSTHDKVEKAVNKFDRFLEKSVSLPKHYDDDDDVDSFAGDDVESGKRKSRKGSKKRLGKKNSTKTQATMNTSDERENARRRSSLLRKQSIAAREVLANNFGIENKPPKTLVIVWVLILAELAFDFVTTVISFMSFASGEECCGFPIDLGPLPMGITIPFFIMVLAETGVLFLCIMITLWPSLATQPVLGAGEKLSLLQRIFCCFRWNHNITLYFVSVTVILNPFFGCVIAWMLMYQSNKAQSFTVLGLEAGSIVLHFASVKLEGSCKTCKELLFHSIQLIPFLTSVVLILIYLKQGGVCYLVKNAVFEFWGCELCEDGFPPVDNVCILANGTNLTLDNKRLWEVDGNFKDLASTFTSRAYQGDYCAADHLAGPDTNFCFYSY